MKRDNTLMYDDTISLILIGDANVGKTSLMKRFTEDTFEENIMGTVGIECFKKIVNIKNSPYLIKIWDTCGQERLKSLTVNYYRNADGIILVFDVNEVDSFSSLRSWVTSIYENTQPAMPKILIANKMDLEVKVSMESVKQFQKENTFEIFEASAKSGSNTKEPFIYIIKEVLKRRMEKNKTIQLDPALLESNQQCIC